MTDNTPIPEDILAASFDLVESLESNKADAATTSDERYARLLTNDANLVARALMAEPRRPRQNSPPSAPRTRGCVGR